MDQGFEGLRRLKGLARLAFPIGKVERDRPGNIRLLQASDGPAFPKPVPD